RPDGRRRRPGGTPTSGRLVVVLADERGDRVRELLGEGGAVGRRGEPHLAVQRERRQLLAGLGGTADRVADIAYKSGGNGQQAAGRDLVRRACGVGLQPPSAAGEITYDPAVARRTRSVTLPFPRSSASSTSPW